MRHTAHTLLCGITAAAVAGIPGRAATQGTTTLRSIGQVTEDRVRLAQLLGGNSDGFLLRDGSRVTNDSAGLRRIAPELYISYNSALMAPENDGGLWSGRGMNVLVRGGLTVRWLNIRLTIAPEITHSANEPFEVPMARVADWRGFASPWRTTELPADLPLRFGDAAITRIDPGQSALSASFSRVAVGIASGNLWWGPGLRNGLVLSNHAGGIPRAFVRSTTPIATSIGAFGGELFVGGLTESLYFDWDPENDLRAVAGAALTFAPEGRAFEGLTVGMGHLVISPVRNASQVASHAFDALTKWSIADPHDHMLTLFGRWVPPQGGFEVWGEYASTRLPTTFREVATQPNADMGWTLGAQWLVPQRDGSLRLQVEFTNVEQSRVDSDATHTPRDWGVGRHTAQGFTQRGQMLGLATGPGSSNAWLAVDRIFPAWSAGAFAARTRWENDAFYREGIINFFAHDVSLIGGVRGQRRSARHDTGISFTFERRYNYLFENGTITPGHRGQRTVNNLRVTLSLSPRSP